MCRKVCLIGAKTRYRDVMAIDEPLGVVPMHNSEDPPNEESQSCYAQRYEIVSQDKRQEATQNRSGHNPRSRKFQDVSSHSLHWAVSQ